MLHVALGSGIRHLGIGIPGSRIRDAGIRIGTWDLFILFGRSFLESGARWGAPVWLGMAGFGWVWLGMAVAPSPGSMLRSNEPDLPHADSLVGRRIPYRRVFADNINAFGTNVRSFGPTDRSSGGSAGVPFTRILSRIEFLTCEILCVLLLLFETLAWPAAEVDALGTFCLG